MPRVLVFLSVVSCVATVECLEADHISLLQTRAERIVAPASMATSTDLASYVFAEQGSVACPKGYAPLSEEKCRLGVSIDGKTYTFSSYSECQTHRHWPTGCFAWSTNVYWSNCEGRALSTADHDGVCELAQGGTTSTTTQSSYVFAEQGSLVCPLGFAPLSEEECRLGVRFGGKAYTFSPYSECQTHAHWPTGCFTWSTNVYWSDCEGRALSTPDHDGVCKVSSTTTTTVVSVAGLDGDEREREIADEQENVHECQNWCYSKKHINKNWKGKKCNWFACSTCPECEAA